MRRKKILIILGFILLLGFVTYSSIISYRYFSECGVMTAVKICQKPTEDLGSSPTISPVSSIKHRNIELYPISHALSITPWKSYRDPEFGFSFKYPHGWDLEPKGKKVLNSDLGQLTKFSFELYWYPTTSGAMKEFDTFDIGILPNPHHLSLAEWTEQYRGQLQGVKNPKKIELLPIPLLNESKAEAARPIGEMMSITALFSDSERIYYVSFWTEGSQDMRKVIKEEIIPTFQFETPK